MSPHGTPYTLTYTRIKNGQENQNDATTRTKERTQTLVSTEVPRTKGTTRSISSRVETGFVSGGQATGKGFIPSRQNQ